MEKITRKQVNMYKNIICVPYCDLWYLLYFRNKDGYNSGVYGWNYDFYHINLHTCIVTGYRPFGNIENYDLCNEYNEKAKNIIENRNLSYDEQKEKIENLLEEFIEKITE